MTKNVTITDENGKYIGTTYPKRAKGLVKSGRALFVDDCTIRMSTKKEPSEYKSEVNQMKHIYFNPREWSLEQSQNDNNYFNGMQMNFMNRSVTVERSFINEFDNGLVECLMLGGWNEPYVKVISKNFSLTQDTDYSFVFWLNGGENDKNSEICQLQVIFEGNQKDCNTYRLNRNFIKPLLHYHGWELYSVSFHTPFVMTSANEGEAIVISTQFSFVSGNAPMALKPAKELDFYKDWEDVQDEFAELRPQRHNIVFEDGWPSLNMYGGDKYSTEALRARKNAETESFFNTARRTVEGFPGTKSFRDAMQTVKHEAGKFAEQVRNTAFTGNWGTSDDSDSEAADQKAELFNELLDCQQEVEDNFESLQECCEEASAKLLNLQMRYGKLFADSRVTADERTILDSRFAAMTKELAGMTSQLSSIETQLHAVQKMNSDAPKWTASRCEEGIAMLESLDNLMDFIDSHCDGIKSSLESLEDYLSNIESRVEES